MRDQAQNGMVKTDKGRLITHIQHSEKKCLKTE